MRRGARERFRVAAARGGKQDRFAGERLKASAETPCPLAPGGGIQNHGNAFHNGRGRGRGL